MKKLYLVRHAKSSWKFTDLTDIERPLNKRGRNDVPKMGDFLKAKSIKPDLLLSSPANRALTTAKGLAQKLNIPVGEIEVQQEIYHASSSGLLNIVKQVDQEFQTLMMFGHNPGFTDFANLLANTNIFNIPTCGVAIVKFGVEHWADIEFGKGMLENFYYPKGI